VTYVIKLGGGRCFEERACARRGSAVVDSVDTELSGISVKPGRRPGCGSHVGAWRKDIYSTLKKWSRDCSVRKDQEPCVVEV
jgi:hypothetical protein